MGPQNMPIGDQSIGQLPHTEVQQQDLTAERKMAKFSKTDEFKALKQALESRINFYQNYLPGNGNVHITQLPNEERGHLWMAATIVIDEFRSIIAAYDQAAEAVSDADAAS